MRSKLAGGNVNEYLEKIDKINKLKVSHRNWCESFEMTYILMLSASIGDVICITGPSRSGKSRLAKTLAGIFSSEFEFEETGFIPAVFVEAVNDSQYGAFSTKSFALRILKALKHPKYGTDEFQESAQSGRISETVYRNSLVNGLKNRKTKYLFVDESQHTEYARKSSEVALAVMDSWKSMANDADIILVIIGAYPILEITRKSNHLVGRRYLVHLKRYMKNLEDVREFAVIVSSFGKAIGEEEVLVDNLDILHKGSLGCIGLLKKWLIKALAHSFVKNKKLSRKILIETISTDDDLRGASAEILSGEKLLQSTFFQELLSEGKIVDIEETAVKLKKGAKPGNRKPARLKLNNRLGGDNE